MLGRARPARALLCLVRTLPIDVSARPSAPPRAVALLFKTLLVLPRCPPPARPSSSSPSPILSPSTCSAISRLTRTTAFCTPLHPESGCPLVSVDPPVTRPLAASFAAPSAQNRCLRSRILPSWLKGSLALSHSVCHPLSSQRHSHCRAPIHRGRRPWRTQIQDLPPTHIPQKELTTQPAALCRTSLPVSPPFPRTW